MRPVVVASAIRDELCADLDAWAARYPVFDPDRFPALALTTVAYLPAVRREDRALAALLSLWIIAFDALVDEGDLDAAALAALAARYDTLLDADAPGWHADPPAGWAAAQQLDDALRTIVALLARYHPPAPLQAWWVTSCRATIAAITRQRGLGRADGQVPGYGAALPLLVDSIGVRPYLAVGAIVGRESGVAGRMPALAALAGECALAIRLANDLRTWEKDGREGGFNTLVALRAELARVEPALSTIAARARALSTLRERLADSRVRLVVPTGAGSTETAMVRLTEVVIGIYAAHDYHTFRESGG